ncbi:MAG: 3-phosphoshikimate 1-carboxyvinyltransferase [Clostridia bacterium]|nr:3-phosphoshikimate 1-carboxyvinyltransferase [Clostridia bacterium]
MNIHIQPVAGLRGKMKAPGDKSISHRAVMFGSLSQGLTEISGFLSGEDCLATIKCFQQMGVEIAAAGKTGLKIHGVGLEGLLEPKDVLDVGNSGTTLRLITGILAGQKFHSVLTGDESLRNRPMDRIIKPLGKMGAEIRAREGGYPPISIWGKGNLTAIDYRTPVPSAQIKSSILLAGLFSRGLTSVSESFKSRDHTERMASAFGAEIKEGRDGSAVYIKGFPRLSGRKVDIPGDISSAAFFMVAGSIVPNSEIVITDVGVNFTRSGILEVLKSMGAKISLFNHREICNEPVADVLIRSSTLRSAEIGGGIIPRLIDEIPVIAAAACFAEGTTVIRDAGELRVKETDRIEAAAQELGRMGAKIKPLKDGLVIQGTGYLKGCLCKSYGDHRIAMALAVAGLAADGETIIEDCQCVGISYPGFFEQLKKLSY